MKRRSEGIILAVILAEVGGTTVLAFRGGRLAAGGNPK